MQAVGKQTFKLPIGRFPNLPKGVPPCRRAATPLGAACSRVQRPHIDLKLPCSASRDVRKRKEGRLGAPPRCHRAVLQPWLGEH